MDKILAALMGLVEGLTEFLPISSTGHLILAGTAFDFEKVMGSKEAAASFEIIIQLGAILAVVAAYPGRFAGLARFHDWRFWTANFWKGAMDPKQGLAGFRGLALLAITSIPAALVGLAAHKLIKEKLFCPETVAAALAAGAVWILAVEYFRPKARTEGVDAITWKEALSIGMFQCLSLWPGMSRSASTILGGMMSGVERKTATEYSFFASVPIMIAATGFEFYKHFIKASERPDLGLLAIGFIVSFVSAWVAVKVFIGFVSRHTLVPFGWYRLALAAVVFACWFAGLLNHS